MQKVSMANTGRLQARAAHKTCVSAGRAAMSSMCPIFSICATRVVLAEANICSGGGQVRVSEPYLRLQITLHLGRPEAPLPFQDKGTMATPSLDNNLAMRALDGADLRPGYLSRAHLARAPGRGSMAWPGRSCASAGWRSSRFASTVSLPRSCRL